MHQGCELLLHVQLDRDQQPALRNLERLKYLFEGGRRPEVSLTIAADNKSWLGDLYDSSQDSIQIPPNWAGRR